MNFQGPHANFKTSPYSTAVIQYEYAGANHSSLYEFANIRVPPEFANIIRIRMLKVRDWFE